MPRPERPLESDDDQLLQFAAELRRLREQAGGPTYRELSKTANYSTSVLSEAAGGRRRPTLAVTLAYVEACGGDPAEWEARWHALGDAPADDVAELEDAAAGPAPYVGLAAFQPDDADRFYGRGKLVRTLLARVEQRRFVGVFGASGSGKSSLLRAGLVARASTPTVLFTPGPHPMEECAIQLAELTGGSAAAVRAELDADPHNLHLHIRQAMARYGAEAELLVVIDQFEEIFTLCRDRGERSRFITALVLASTAETSRTRVVIGVRADFYGHCGQHPDLVAALHDAQVLVGPMTADELREAITAPAARAGCLVETALVSRLISDTSGQGAVLPLVSHALLETWRRRSGARLTLGGYEAAGGIQYAIARSAEQVHTALDVDQQRLARQIFLRLTALGEGTEDTKRRIKARELDTDDPNTAVVLEKLVRARLLTSHHDTVEIAHEALIRSWPRLRDWLADDREGLRIHRQLTEATEAWRSLDRDPGALYRGTRLATAKEWASGQDGVLTTHEREFLAASLSAQAEEQTAARRRTRRLRQLVALLAVLLVLASAAIVYAVRAERGATEQRNIAIARKVVGDATALRATNPALAAQLGLAAYRLMPIAETRDNLLSTFTAPFAARLTGHTQDVTSAALNPKGDTLATGGGDNTVRLWDVHQPAEIGTLTGHAAAVNAVAYSPDDTTVVSADNDGIVRIWDVLDPRNPRSVTTLHGHAGSVNAVAFSPDFRTFATAGHDKIVRLWDLRDRREIGQLAGHTATILSVAFSPDGATLATASHDKTVRLWDLRGHREIGQLAGHTATLRSVAFSPDGATLATAGHDKIVRVWNTRERRVIATLTGHTDIVNTLAFSPDGRILASGGNDYTVRLWDLSESDGARELATLTGHTNIVTSVVFSDDGATLATTSSDRTARLESIPDLLLGRHTDALRVAVFSPEGQTLATTSNDGTARLWDLKFVGYPRELAVIGDRATVASAALFSPDGRILATSHDDKLVRLWDVADRNHPALLGTLAGHTDAVYSSRFGPDGRIIATVSGDGTTRLWDIGDPRAPRELGVVPTGTATSMRFSPDGRMLATANTDKTARLWDVTDPRKPRELAALTGHTARVTQAAFSPDGRTLATASWDHTARLWDISDPRRPVELATLAGHAETVTSVVFSPDGRTLATGSHDRTARLWDVGDPRRPADRATLAGHTDVVISVVFSPDGRTLVTGGHDRIARLWDVDADRVATRICELAQPRITEAEWHRYFSGLPYQPPCR